MNSELAAQQRASKRKSQTVLNVLSLVVVLFAAYEAFGVGNLFGYRDLSNDDAEEKMTADMVRTLIDPIGFAKMLTLLLAAIVIHSLSKRNRRSSTATTRRSLIATVVLFIMGFFRFSVILPMTFATAGWMGATVQNKPDSRQPTVQEYTLDAVELVQYQSAEGVRMTTAVTNAGGDPWQLALVYLVFSDVDGTACGHVEYEEEFVAPGERRAITTDFLDASIDYSDPSCVPASATAELININIDSRAQIPDSDYEQARDRAAVTPLTSLAVSEQLSPVGNVNLAITGSVDPAVIPELMQGNGAAALPLGFEVVDQRGLRLAWCFKPDDVAPDGGFVTGSYHSPVGTGEYVSVAVVPKC
ncbi:hypothetical protein D6T65_15725 [Arthrobacter frigidicola]|nr:hypothetical protein D6T65_15725 [Arthrobacter frigidicola]